MGDENLGMVLDQSVSYFLLYLFLQEKCLKIISDDFDYSRKSCVKLKPGISGLRRVKNAKKNPHLTARKLHQIMLQWCITFLLL